MGHDHHGVLKFLNCRLYVLAVHDLSPRLAPAPVKVATNHYRKPRRSAISSSNSRRFNNLPPEAIYRSRSLWSSLPSFETGFALSPFFLGALLSVTLAIGSF